MDYDTWKMNAPDRDEEFVHYDDYCKASDLFQGLLDASYDSDYVDPDFIEDKLMSLADFFGVQIPKEELRLKKI